MPDRPRIGPRLPQRLSVVHLSPTQQQGGAPWASESGEFVTGVDLRGNISDAGIPLSAKHRVLYAFGEGDRSYAIVPVGHMAHLRTDGKVVGGLLIDLSASEPNAIQGGEIADMTPMAGYRIQHSGPGRQTAVINQVFGVNRALSPIHAPVAPLDRKVERAHAQFSRLMGSRLCLTNDNSVDFSIGQVFSSPLLSVAARDVLSGQLHSSDSISPDGWCSYARAVHVFAGSAAFTIHGPDRDRRNPISITGKWGGIESGRACSFLSFAQQEIVPGHAMVISTTTDPRGRMWTDNLTDAVDKVVVEWGPFKELRADLQMPTVVDRDVAAVKAALNMRRIGMEDPTVAMSRLG